MRVTKLIKEYVEATVKAMPKFKDLTSAEKEYRAWQEKIEIFRNKLDKDVDEMVEEAIYNFRIDNNIPQDITIERASYSKIRADCYASSIADQARAGERKRKDACKDAINNILLNLELGATRQELDEMLTKLAQ